MRLLRLTAVAIILFGMTACHSAYVEATVTNATSAAVTLVEVDYPSASFGTQSLAPQQQYHYRFKILGEGPLKLIYTDQFHKEISSNGPNLHEGDEGSLRITITPQAVQWEANAHKH